jgi:hypothetical protein
MEWCMQPFIYYIEYPAIQKDLANVEAQTVMHVIYNEPYFCSRDCILNAPCIITTCVLRSWWTMHKYTSLTICARTLLRESKKSQYRIENSITIHQSQLLRPSTALTVVATRGIWPYMEENSLKHLDLCKMWPFELLMPVDPISNILPAVISIMWAWVWPPDNI